MWTLNGTFMARSSLRYSVPTSPILSCCVSEIGAWSVDTVAVTGHEDGRIRLWTLTYVPMDVNDDVAMSAARLHETVCTGQVPSASGFGAAHGAVVKISEDEGYTIFSRELKLLDTLPSQDTTGSSSAHPSPISAVCIDNLAGKIYTGDQQGYVLAWTRPDVAGRSNDHWVKDSHVASCMECKVRFTFSERRHHCRKCGRVVCNTCSSFESAIPNLSIHRPVRVCKQCYAELRQHKNTALDLEPL